MFEYFTICKWEYNLHLPGSIYVVAGIIWKLISKKQKPVYSKKMFFSYFYN